LTIIAVAAVFIAASAPAELIIYKGTLRGSFYGQNLSEKLNFGFYLVVDYDTANVAEIQYASIRGNKFYSSNTETNLQFMEMNGPNGKTIQAISIPPNSCDTSEGITSAGVLAKGATSVLTINTNSTISFPKVLSGGGRGIDSSSGQPTYIENTVVVSFDSPDTLTSNENGETMDAAVTRLTNALQAQGYSEASEKKQAGAGTRRSLKLLR